MRPGFSFSIDHTDGAARSGRLATPHGRIETPAFMPVATYGAVRGIGPQDLEEIGAHFGLRSVATVHKHVQHLVEKGLLKKAWNRSRSVEPVAPPGGEGVVTLPLAGVVAAGAPIEAA